MSDPADYSYSHAKWLSFSAGTRAAIPIAVGYIPIGITFGLLAKSTGIPDFITVFMSLLIFAGASQFVGINLIALGANPWGIVLTTFLINLRHLLMSASISQRVKPTLSKKHLAVLSFGITDETFSVASLRTESKLDPAFILGLNLLSFAAWNVGTWLGVFLAAGFPTSLRNSMSIALYAMFIGLLVPACRSSISIAAIAITAMTVQSILTYLPIFAFVSLGLKIVIATIIAALAGAVWQTRGDR